jgi:hypothetical protein
MIPIRRRTISPLTMPAVRTTSGVGSAGVCPVRMRKEPIETKTAVSTITSPKVRETRRRSATVPSAGSSMESLSARAFMKTTANLGLRSTPLGGALAQQA